MIPFFKLPFLESVNVGIDTSENVSSSRRGVVCVHYSSPNYSGVREIRKKSLLMKIDKEDFYGSKKKVEYLKTILERLNFK